MSNAVLLGNEIHLTPNKCYIAGQCVISKCLQACSMQHFYEMIIYFKSF